MTENRAADLADCCTSKRAPGNSRGLLIVQQGCCLPADLEAGSAAGAATLGARNVTAGDKLDPQRIRALVVRSVARLAQRIEAVHRRTRGCRRESRQLEHHPRTGIQFRGAEGQVRPFGRHLVLGARTYVRGAVGGELLAIAAENDRRPLRCRVASDSTTAGGNREGNRCSGSTASAGTGARSTSTCSTTRGRRSLCARRARPSTAQIGRAHV